MSTKGLHSLCTKWHVDTELLQYAAYDRIIPTPRDSNNRGRERVVQYFATCRCIAIIHVSAWFKFEYYPKFTTMYRHCQHYLRNIVIIFTLQHSKQDLSFFIQPTWDSTNVIFWYDKYSPKLQCISPKFYPFSSLER